MRARRRARAEADKARRALLHEIACLRRIGLFYKDQVLLYPHTLALLAAAEQAYVCHRRRRFEHDGHRYRIATSNIGRLIVWDEATGQDLVSTFPAGGV